MTQTRLVQIERDILAKNDASPRTTALARRARHPRAEPRLQPRLGQDHAARATPSSACAGRLPLAVIEGDQQTSFDAERIRATGAAAVQVNTGKGCHLDADMVATRSAAWRRRTSVLIIENVGNLVCPAAFDLGEAHKVVVLSVTEGEDKPLKYPDMFRAAGLMLLNKIDLLPHLRFDVEKCLANARRVNPAIEILRLSATTGEGMDAWLAWIEAERAARSAAAGG